MNTQLGEIITRKIWRKTDITIWLKRINKWKCNYLREISLTADCYRIQFKTNLLMHTAIYSVTLVYDNVWQCIELRDQLLQFLHKTEHEWLMPETASKIVWKALVYGNGRQPWCRIYRPIGPYCRCRAPCRDLYRETSSGRWSDDVCRANIDINRFKWVSELVSTVEVEPFTSCLRTSNFTVDLQ